MTFDFRRALTVLAAHEVEFIVVGGISAILRGAPVVTLDLDIVHRRTPDNVRRLLVALRSIDARYRHDPRGLVPEAQHLLGPGHNLLQTTCGPLDALGAIDDGLSYDDLLPDSEEMRVGPDLSARVLSLRRLVELKAATGRPKDVAVLPTLRATLVELERTRDA
ncbi:MAG: hypothetical protein IPN03_06620 [Holophagales bacterium]|nr:hypothetical protein [Holophagales bacterium]MBK9373399.1 hypothetical protein [Holophagales bacterium]